MEELRFDGAGLVPAVAQDVDSGTVLMLAYANREALERTLATGRAHYWSRSRRALWEKGATSGNTQAIVEVRADCDGDAVLYRVRQSGPACHTGAGSCFHRAVEEGGLAAAAEPAHVLARLEGIVRDREAERPDGSYTTYLFAQGKDKMLKKVGEEATEIVIAAKNDDRTGLAGEVSDLLFHLLVLLRQQGVPLADVWAELERRFGGASRLPRPTPANHTRS